MFAFAQFVAGGLSRGSAKGAGYSVSPLLRLSILAMSLSLSVMLISTSIILGFKKQVSSLAYGQTGHASLYAWGANWLNSQRHIQILPALLDEIRSEPYVRGAYPLLQHQALLKTKSDYTGVLLYGVDNLEGYPYFTSGLKAGRIPDFNREEGNTDGGRSIVLPSELCRQMQLNLGDKVRLYFLDDRVRVRVFNLAGIYESAGLATAPAFCSIGSLRHLMGLDPTYYSRLVVYFAEDSDHEVDFDRLSHRIDASSNIGEQSMGLSRAEELVPGLFYWLDLLDSNVYLLLVLMLAVGGFSMITALIITVLDRVHQIGILKALGATDGDLRLTFTILGGRLLLWGVFWGNVLSLLLCLGQKYGRFIPLDPQNYFIDAVPIHLSLPIWIVINVGVLILTVLLIHIPTAIISKIKPVEIMRID